MSLSCRTPHPTPTFWATTVVVAGIATSVWLWYYYSWTQQKNEQNDDKKDNGMVYPTMTIEHNVSSLPFLWESQQQEDGEMSHQKSTTTPIHPSAPRAQELDFLASMTFASGGLRAPSCYCCTWKKHPTSNGPRRRRPWPIPCDDAANNVVRHIYRQRHFHRITYAGEDQRHESHLLSIRLWEGQGVAMQLRKGVTVCSVVIEYMTKQRSDCCQETQWFMSLFTFKPDVDILKTDRSLSSRMPSALFLQRLVAMVWAYR